LTVRTTAAAAALAFAALIQPAGAQEAKGAALDPAKAGIAVYPGANADAGVASLLRESLQLTAAAYRTGDSAEKVTAFYARQPGMSQMPGATREQAGFLAGCKDEFNKYMKKNMQKCGYHVTIQNPWMDMKTGKMVADTLISIVRQ
jgi:hypothetical protein